MAMDGLTSLIRNMIGQDNLNMVMGQFEEIRQAAINVSAGINTILRNQQMMELNAAKRHAEVLELFDQMGVRPIPEAAAIPESPANLNGSGEKPNAEFQS